MPSWRSCLSGEDEKTPKWHGCLVKYAYELLLKGARQRMPIPSLLLPAKSGKGAPGMGAELEVI